MSKHQEDSVIRDELSRVDVGLFAQCVQSALPTPQWRDRVRSETRERKSRMAEATPPPRRHKRSAAVWYTVGLSGGGIISPHRPRFVSSEKHEREVPERRLRRRWARKIKRPKLRSAPAQPLRFLCEVDKIYRVRRHSYSCISHV